MAERVARIALTGKIRGSARLLESGGSTAVTLSLFAPAEGLRVITHSAGGMREAMRKEGVFTVPGEGVCAMALFSNGSLVSSGFTAACRGDRARMLEEMRIMAAGEGPRAGAAAEKEAPQKLEQPRAGAAAEKEAPQKREQPRTGARDWMRNNASAQVTLDVIDRARRLFGALDMLSEPNKDPHEGLEPVQNPFPKAFPNSNWYRAREGGELICEASVNGAVRRIEARPAARGARGGSLSGSGRILISRDGMRYAVRALPPGEKNGSDK